MSKLDTTKGEPSTDDGESNQPVGISLKKKHRPLDSIEDLVATSEGSHEPDGADVVAAAFMSATFDGMRGGVPRRNYDLGGELFKRLLVAVGSEDDSEDWVCIHPATRSIARLRELVDGELELEVVEDNEEAIRCILERS